MMPNKDGFQFRRDQLHDPALSTIPVAVYSGHHDPTRYAPFLRADAYLRKPIETGALLKLVEAYSALAHQRTAQH